MHLIRDWACVHNHKQTLTPIKLVIQTQQLFLLKSNHFQLRCICSLPVMQTDAAPIAVFSEAVHARDHSARCCDGSRSSRGGERVESEPGGHE